MVHTVSWIFDDCFNCWSMNWAQRLQAAHGRRRRRRLRYTVAICFGKSSEAA